MVELAPSDEDLVARVVASGDPSAFESLVARHHGRVRRWLRQLTGNRAEADDLAQEAFIRAWLHIDGFSGKGSFPGWVMKIGYHAFLQARRRQGREQRLVAALEAQGPDVAGTDNAGETSADLPTLLAALSENERATMILCYGHGFSHAEAAELTGLPLGTVKSHIRRGKARIESAFDVSTGQRRSKEA